MKRFTVAIVWWFAVGGVPLANAQDDAAKEPVVESGKDDTAGDGGEPDANASNADEALVFRWFDKQGIAHDTTDTSIIPPGARFEVKGGLLANGDLKRRRSWWRARKNRLQAELHNAQDSLESSKQALQRSVDQKEPGVTQAEHAKRVDVWDSEVARLKRELKNLKAEAVKAKVPQRWLKD
jgi:hypothetical protein